MTQHQLALESHRQERIRRILVQKKQESIAVIRARREQENFVLRAAQRIRALPSGYDSDDPDNTAGLGGLGPGPGEEEDWGEACEMWMSVIRRARRRLIRWSGEVDETPEIGTLGRKSWGLLAPNAVPLHDQQVLSAPQPTAPEPAYVPRRGGRRGPRTKKEKAALLETVENGDVEAEADVEITPARSRTVNKLAREDRRPPAEVGSAGGRSAGQDLDDIDKDLLAERSDEGEKESDGDTEMEEAVEEGSDVEMGGYDD